MKAIDLYLISGFLGSGKTTFLQKLLCNLEGLNVGVIINELGSIGIDGALIEKDGIQLIQINNGSIYCSCIKGDFIKTLIDFTKTEIDVLLIENSGMADPSNIHQIIEEVNVRGDRPYHYRGAVCIVDSRTFLKQAEVLASVQNQVVSSNFIVINKIDLVNQSMLQEIKRKLKDLNPNAFLYESMFAEIPFDLLQDKLQDNGYNGETTNKCYNRPASYSLEGGGYYSETDIRTFIDRIGSYILRMKGFVRGEGKWWQVDVVDGQVVIKEIELGKKDLINRTKLVLIGHDTQEFQNVLETIWFEIFQEQPTIYE